MAFFTAERRPRTRYSQWDEQMAGLLAQAMREARRCAVPPALAAWAMEFARLRQEHVPEQVEGLLRWYVAGPHRSQYVPRVYSAATFRRRYAELWAARTRMGGAASAVVVGPEAYAVQRALGGLVWPEGTGGPAEELACIQRSLDNYRQFLADIDTAVAAGRLPAGFRAHVHAQGGDVRSFVAAWVRDIHHMACGWAGWRGTLLDYALTPTSRHFHWVLAGWCRAWRGEGTEVAWLLRALGYAD